jgi:hypothetical protein
VCEFFAYQAEIILNEASRKEIISHRRKVELEYTVDLKNKLLDG